MARGPAEGVAAARLAAILRSRREEVEAEILGRLPGVSDSTGGDPVYREGLREAVAAGFDYALEAIECGEERAPPIPLTLLAQARRAARQGVGLDTVLRRYFAGYRFLNDLLVCEAAAEEPLDAAELRGLLAALAICLDRLLTAIAEEHRRETAERRGSSAERRAERVEGLLSGELLDEEAHASELGYAFEAHHVGLLATGPAARDTVRDLAAALGCRLLLVPRPERLLWAWLGTDHPLEVAELRSLLTSGGAATAVAIGEPGRGLAGWRLSHRQAAAALPIALQGRPQRVVRYADVALLASLRQDELLAASLRQIYLEPLRGEREGAEAACETLRAYFAVGQNVSSAAAALGVNRRTVAKRLRTIEERLGRTLVSCAPDLQAALLLQEAEVGDSPLSVRPAGRPAVPVSLW